MTAKIKKAINNSKSYQKDENSQPKNYENYEKQENNENHKKTNSQTSQFSSEIQKIKRDTYISWIFMAILLLPILDFDIEISYIMIIIAVALGTVFLFFKTRAICLLRKVSKNVKLLKVYVAYIIFSALLSFLPIFLIFQRKKSGTVFFIAMLLIYFSYRYAKELYNSTMQKEFFYALFFECIAAILLVCTFYYARFDRIDETLQILSISSEVFNFISIIISMIAWIRFKEISVQRGY